MTDLSASDVRGIQRALLGLPGHQANAAERARAYVLYARLRRDHYGAVPSREQPGGVQNSLANESMFVRALLGPRP